MTVVVVAGRPPSRAAAILRTHCVAACGLGSADGAAFAGAPVPAGGAAAGAAHAAATEHQPVQLCRVLAADAAAVAAIVHAACGAAVLVAGAAAAAAMCTGGAWPGSPSHGCLMAATSCPGPHLLQHGAGARPSRTARAPAPAGCRCDSGRETGPGWPPPPLSSARRRRAAGQVHVIVADGLLGAAISTAPQEKTDWCGRLCWRTLCWRTLCCWAGRGRGWPPFQLL